MSSMPRKAARAFEKGSALMQKYELQASLPDLRNAIKFAPDLFPAYHNLALVQYNLGEFDDVAQNFQKSIDLSKSSFAPSFFGLCVVLYNRNQLADAERLDRQGLRIEPDSSLGMYGVWLWPNTLSVKPLMPGAPLWKPCGSIRSWPMPIFFWPAFMSAFTVRMPSSPTLMPTSELLGTTT
jgi:tetratricopeptide (TPR) repeat protein